MAKVFDFLKRLYSKKSQDADPVLKTVYEAAVKARTCPAAVAARGRLLDQFSKSEQDFDRSFASYYVSLNLNARNRDWNLDIEGLARKAGMSDARVAAAKIDFVEAVIQRIEICWFMELTSTIAPGHSTSAVEDTFQKE